MTGTINVSQSSGIPKYNVNSYSVNSFPNPFSNEISISFTLPENVTCNVSIYDLTGKLIRVLADRNFAKGDQLLKWDAKDENGDELRPGIFFFIIERKGLQDVSGKKVYSE